MKKHVIHILMLIVALASSAAYAGTQALGFEFSVSTYDQVKALLSKQTDITELDGVNKFSGGPMLTTDGTPFALEGLKAVTYIFDRQKKLAGLILDMDKERSDFVFQAMSAKYKVATQQRPVVGDKYATFNTGDAVIQISAPHLSFQMVVIYLRNDVQQQFKAQSAAEAADKSKRDAAKF